MKYFKVVQNGYISYTGIDICVGVEITEEEYEIIEKLISEKPLDTETHYHALNADMLEYEAIERKEAVILNDITQSEEYLAGYDQAVLDLMGV